MSPAKSTAVNRPSELAAVGWETATANFSGWPAGPTGPMALTTGRYWLPQPTVESTAAKLSVRTAMPARLLRRRRFPTGWCMWRNVTNKQYSPEEVALIGDRRTAPTKEIGTVNQICAEPFDI